MESALFTFLMVALMGHGAWAYEPALAPPSQLGETSDSINPSPAEPAASASSISESSTAPQAAAAPVTPAAALSSDKLTAGQPANDLGSGKVSSESADKEKSSYVICRNDKLVRTIRVDLKGGSCRAIYTKNGQDDIVGKSGTPNVCYEVVKKIRTNLEKTVWKCQDVNPDRVSFTQE